MRAAALDLGSNTLRLIVAQVDKNGWRALGRGLATPRLGRDLEPGGRLHPESKAAAIRQARRFVQKARDLGAKRIVLAATQACRVAEDGAEFAAQLKDQFSLDRARVISGEEEARLSRLGVLSRLTGPAEGAWLADIGGGSTELVKLTGDGEEAISLPLGAVSLTRAHVTGDPPGPMELEALNRAVEKGLAGLTGLKVKRLAATAGTAAALAAIRLGMTEYEPEELNNLVVSADDLGLESRRLAAMTLEQRRGALALEPQRAEIILAGLAILKGLVRVFDLKKFVVMDAGLLEGILLDDVGYFEQINNRGD